MTFAEVAESHKRCRFPLGVDDWCGARTVPGCSWCPLHRAIVFLPKEAVPTGLDLAALTGERRGDRPSLHPAGGDPQPGWRRDPEIAA